MRALLVGWGLWSCLTACGSPPPAEEPAADAAFAEADDSSGEGAATTDDETADDVNTPPKDEPTAETAGSEDNRATSEAAAAHADGNGGAPDEPAAPPSQPAGNPVEETRTTAVIHKVVLSHRHSVRDCYEIERRKEPTLRGTLTIQFEINPSGRVTRAELNTKRSTLRQPALVSCAIAAVQRMNFPPSSRGFESTVNYPFDFKP